MTVQRTLHVRTRGRGFTDLTADVAAIVGAGRIGAGLCSVFIQHTSASLLIQENADPAVLRDLGRYFERLAPESASYEHADEGPDDMPSHLRAALTHTSVTIPIVSGALALGTWQAIYLYEHRERPHERRVIVTLVG